MNDEDILEAIGLSEEDATDLACKHQAYLKSLNPAQLAAVNRALPSPEDLVAAISDDMTVEDLNQWVAARCNTDLVAGALSVPFNIDDDDDEQ